MTWVTVSKVNQLNLIIIKMVNRAEIEMFSDDYSELCVIHQLILVWWITAYSSTENTLFQKNIDTYTFHIEYFHYTINNMFTYS